MMADHGSCPIVVRYACMDVYLALHDLPEPWSAAVHLACPIPATILFEAKRLLCCQTGQPTLTQVALVLLMCGLACEVVL